MKKLYRKLERMNDRAQRRAGQWIVPVLVLLVAGLIYGKYVDYKEAETGEVSEHNRVCHSSMTTGDCVCLHRLTGERIETTQEECRKRVRGG